MNNKTILKPRIPNSESRNRSRGPHKATGIKSVLGRALVVEITPDPAAVVMVH